MNNAFDMILYGFNQVFDWCLQIEYEGINVLMVAMFGLVLALFWRFFLSPVFGASGGSLGISLSDFVKRSSNFNKKDKDDQ